MSSIKGWDKDAVARFLVTFSEITATASAISIAIWKIFFAPSSEPVRPV